MNLDADQNIQLPAGCSGTFNDRDKDFSFPCATSPSEDDEELTESKIKAFLDEKVLILVELRISCHFLYKDPILGVGCGYMFICQICMLSTDLNIARVW